MCIRDRCTPVRADSVGEAWSMTTCTARAAWGSSKPMIILTRAGACVFPPVSYTHLEGLDRAAGEELGLEVSVQAAKAAAPYADGFYLTVSYTHLDVYKRQIFLKEGTVFAHRSVDEIRENEGMSVDAYFREVFKC